MNKDFKNNELKVILETTPSILQYSCRMLLLQDGSYSSLLIRQCLLCSAMDGLASHIGEHSLYFELYSIISEASLLYA